MASTRFASVLGGICIGWIVAMIWFATSAGAVDDVPALIFFGDSTLDAGNNNYLPTLVKSNFMPYGRDLGGQFSAGSGRFCNGLMVPDYLAQAFELPSALSYLNPEATGDKLLTGVNFASAGSGWLDSTSTIFSVRSIKQQRNDFREYIGRLTELVGANRTQEILSTALYTVSSGTNDYIDNYYLFPVQQWHYSVEEWQDQIVSEASELLQDLYSLGARKILMASMPAFGCLPAAITLHGGGSDECVQYINDAARNTNSAIQEMLQGFEEDQGFPGLQFELIDIYSFVLDAFDHPAKWGFEETRYACCGSGTVEVAVLCNSDTLGTCKDASKYLFFDSFHPTQAFYAAISRICIQNVINAFL